MLLVVGYLHKILIVEEKQREREREREGERERNFNKTSVCNVG